MTWQELIFFSIFACVCVGSIWAAVWALRGGDESTRGLRDPEWKWETKETRKERKP